MWKKIKYLQVKSTFTKIYEIFYEVTLITDQPEVANTFARFSASVSAIDQYPTVFQ